MAEITHENAVKFSILSQQDFADKYHTGITLSALNYAIKNDKIDYVKFGNFRNVVLTQKTLDYKPNLSKKRPKDGRKKMVRVILAEEQ
jgi:hypothetical protein